MFLFVFPGQGSQSIGMGKQLFDAFPSARSVFEEVDDILSQRLTKTIFQGPDDALNLTENTQPALMAVSIAIMRVLETEGNFNLAQSVKYVAGHSLGEYSALTAAGALQLKDATRLLRIRGRAMQRATPIGQGAMAAILGLTPEMVENICQKAAQGQVCDIANDNCDGQIVISGHQTAIARAIEVAHQAGAKKCVLLPVSASFHCSLMQPAADEIKRALTAVEMQKPLVPILTNVSAQAQSDPTILKEHLVQQVTGPVRWRETISKFDQKKISAIVEIGAGRVLTGLAKRIQPTVERFNLQTPVDIESFLTKI